MDIDAMQAAIRDAGADGWLLFDFRRSNPLAHRVLGLPSRAFFSRRWMYYIPARGQPTKLVSAVESHALATLPGSTRVYRTWQEYQGTLKELVGGARRVAMEYVADNAIPYCSYVDAGTVGLVRSFGPEVVSSADFAQRFEAVLTPAQLDSHRAAGRALLRARDGIVAWLRGRIEAETEPSEFETAQMFARLMAAEGLRTDADFQPHVAVNGNAANPHYAATAEQSAAIRRGDLLLLDFWAPLQGEGDIVADYTWMYVVGERVPERVAQLFAVISEARDTGIALLRRAFEAGETIRGFEVDDAVRAVVERAGYGEAFVHRTGHNITTATHGNGAHLDNLETHDTRPLFANTCTSVEPGIYLLDEGLGLRTEVDVLLLPGGVEVTGVPAQEAVVALLA